MKTQIFTRVLIGFIILFSSIFSFSATYYVNDNSKVGDLWCSAIGSNNTIASGGGTKSKPFLTLKYALQQITTNDIIYIESGTYSDQVVNETYIKKNNISIIGAGPTLTKFNYAGSTNASGNYFMRIKGFNNITIKNFQVNGYISDVSHSGQIFNIENAQNILIENIVFSKNLGAAGEAAIYVTDNSTVVFNSVSFICQNNSSLGGGIEVEGIASTSNINVTINNSLISNNDKSDGTSGTNGGGILISGDKTTVVTINNTMISDNKAGQGAGVFVNSGILNLNNCIIKDNFSVGDKNFASYGGGITLFGTSGLCTFTNCLFSNNEIDKTLGSSPAGITNPLSRGGAIGINGVNSKVDLKIVSCSFINNKAYFDKFNVFSGTDLYTKASSKSVNVTIDDCSLDVLSNSIVNSSGTVTVTNSGTYNFSGTILGDTKVRTSTTTPVTPNYAGSCPFVSVCNPATVGPDQTVTCPATTATLTTTGPSGSVFYLYSDTTLAYIDTASTILPTFPITGVSASKTYYIKSSLDGCGKFVPIKITYDCPSCNTTISYSPAVVCSGNAIMSVTKTNSSNNSATFSISPVNAGSTAALSANGDFDPSKITVAGKYTITMAEGASCNPTFDITVNLKPATPTKGILTQPNCTVTTGTIQLNSSDDPVTYGFNPSTGISANGTGLVTASPGTYKIAASKGGCTSDTISVTFNTVPGQPVLSGAGEICVDSTITLKAWTDNTLTTPSTPNAVKPWVSSDITVATVINGAILGKKGGTTIITYTDAANCTQTASITVDPKAAGGTATATNIALCANATTTINLTGSLGSIQWQSSIDGTNWSDIKNENGTTFNTSSSLAPGTYHFRAQVKNGVCSLVANSNVVDITVSQAPVAGTATANPSTICSGDKSTITLANYTGTIQWQESTTGTNGTWINCTTGVGFTSASYTSDKLTKTIYYRTVVSSGTCKADTSSPVKVTVNPNITAAVTVTSNPPLTISTPNDILKTCPDNSVVFTADTNSGLQNVTYQWYKNSNILQDETKNTYATIVLNDGDIISVKVTADGTCVLGSPVTSKPILVKIPTNPLLTLLTTTKPSKCGFSDGTIESTAVSSGTLTWYNKGSLVPINSHIDLPYKITGLKSGAYHLVFNDGLCEFTKDLSISDPGAPSDPILSYLNDSICENDNFTLTATFTSITGTESFVWKKDNVDLSVTTNSYNAKAVISTSGVNESHTYSVYLEDKGCKSSIDQVTLSFISTPNPSIINSNPIFCASDRKKVADLTAKLTTPIKKITWYDLPAGGTKYQDTNLLVQGKKYYAEQSEGTCTSPSRLPVVVNVITLTAPVARKVTQPDCKNDSGVVILNLPSAGDWKITASPVVGAPIVLTKTVTVNPFDAEIKLAPETYTIICEDVVNGCVSPTLSNVAINPTPQKPATPVLDPLGNYCSSKSYMLDQVLFSPAGTVKYFSADSTIEYAGSTTKLLPNTTYKFVFMIGQCASPKALTTKITMDAGPTVLPIDMSDELICAVKKPTFDSLVSTLFNKIKKITSIPVPAGYKVIFALDPSGNPIVNNTFAVGTLNGNKQTIYYNVMNDKGCQNTQFSSLIFKINEGPKDLTLKGGTNYFCESKHPTVADLASTKTSAGAGILTWYSTETGNGAFKDTDPLISGLYYASLTANPGCESVSRQQVNVSIVSFGQTTLDAGNSYVFCQNSTNKVADLPSKSSTLTPLVWSIDGKTQLSTDALIQGTYTAAETQNDCVSDKPQQVVVSFQKPSISIIPKKLPICGAGHGKLGILGENSTYTYVWFKNGVQLSETGSSIEGLTDDKTIKYNVTVTDTKGCWDTTHYYFSDCEPSLPPQIITPNGDKKNDTFVLHYAGKYPSCKLTIYNRWGALVYESEIPYKDDWDGKPNVGATLGSNVLPSATYFYMIDKGDGTDPESGFVELVK